MSNNVRYDLAAARVLGFAKVTISTATTTAFDFGTPDNLGLNLLSTYHHGDRIVVVLTATTAGTTDALTWVIQDADDSSGAIGTPATALATFVTGALSAGTGDDQTVAAVQLQASRPWLKMSVTRVGTTDTHVCHCTVLAVPSNA
jgi:hypothetical protein